MSTDPPTRIWVVPPGVTDLRRGPRWSVTLEEFEVTQEPVNRLLVLYHWYGVVRFADGSVGACRATSLREQMPRTWHMAVDGGITDGVAG